MTVTIHVGDCIDVLRTLPAESVHCVVTSPPYYGLRDYNVEGQVGLEDSPDAYVAKLVEVFREVRRVLHRTGVVWLNLGDSYATNRNDHVGGGFGDNSVDVHSTIAKRGKFVPDGLKMKDLMMIPARVALALQADGWWLRSQVIWHKPNAMPESVTDRPTTDYECVYLLAKEARYFYDADAIREPFNYPDRTYNTNPEEHKTWELRENGNRSTSGLHDGREQYGDPARGRNKRTVWTIPTRPFSEAHFATFPVDLVEPMIRAGASERGACPVEGCGCQWERVVEIERGEKPPGLEACPKDVGHNGRGTESSMLAQPGWREWRWKRQETTGWRPTCDHDADPVPAVCLDPFGGAGTVGLVADRLERDAILIELNESYAQMAARRIYEDAGMFADVEVIP